MMRYSWKKMKIIHLQLHWLHGKIIRIQKQYRHCRNHLHRMRSMNFYPDLKKKTTSSLYVNRENHKKVQCSYEHSTFLYLQFIFLGKFSFEQLSINICNDRFKTGIMNI